METNNFVRFAVPYAKRDDGTAMRRTEAQEARNKGLRIPSLICPACGHGVAYRQEHARARGHFYHSDGSVGGGGCGLESEIHAAFKAAVAAELSENGLDTNLILGRGGPASVWHGKASVEHRTEGNRFRLDVAFHSEGHVPVAIEVINTSALDLEKRNALHVEGWMVLTLQPRQMSQEHRILFWDAEDRVAFARTLLPLLRYRLVRFYKVQRTPLRDDEVLESSFACQEIPVWEPFDLSRPIGIVPQARLLEPLPALPPPPAPAPVSMPVPVPVRPPVFALAPPRPPVAAPAPALKSAPKATTAPRPKADFKPVWASIDDMRRAKALQIWHTNPTVFPRPFASYRLSDFENATKRTTEETIK